MTVLSGGDIAKYADKNIHNLITRLPNVNMVTQGVNDVIYIRGFGSSPNNFAFDPDVSVYVDGIYEGKSGELIEPLFDVDHVEVLRGPQGALLGKNTAAGAISIITASPSSSFGGEATVLYNFLEKGPEVDGYVTGPITSTLSGRLAVKLIDQDGFLRNEATSTDDPHIDQDLIRGSLTWTPSADFDATGKLEYVYFKENGGINIDGPLTSAPPDNDTRYVQEPYGPSGLPEVNGVSSTNASLNANYHAGNYTITSITGLSYFTRYPINGYDEANPDGGPLVPGNNVYQNGFPERFTQVSQEFRLLSPTGGKFDYVLGAYVDHSVWNLRQNIFYDLASGFDGAQYTNFYQIASTYSGFVIANYHFTNSLLLRGSFRYTDNEKTGDFTSGTYYGRPLRALTDVSAHLSEGSGDPSVTLQYDATRHVMVYASFAEGSKSGGFVSNTFGIMPDDFQFAPERSRNYEVGLKSTLADGRLLLDASIYDLQIKNLQVSSYVPSISSFVTDNAAEATSKGAEAFITWRPVNPLTFTASGAYLDAKYDQYLGAACLASDPVSVCNPASPASVAVHNLAGETLEYASKWTGNIEAHHTASISDSLRLDSTIMASYRSAYFKSDNYSQVYGIQPGAVKINARIELSQPGSGWSIAIAGKNLTNVYTFSNTLALPASVTAQARTISYLDELRSVWLEVSKKF